MARYRLLVVDDDVVVTSILEAILRGAGYEVQVLADGLAAMELLDRDAGFQTVLLDRMMPGLDGLAVLQQMKQNPRLKDIPVVLQTAMDREEEVEEGLRAGAMYYLLKPIDPKIVLQVVAAATSEYDTRRQFWMEMQGTRSAMGLIRRGIFRYRTLQECHDLAALLGKACPDPKRSVVGLSELMINALEHGNLGITYDEKTALVEEQQWHAEVARRLELPEYAHKVVTVTLTRSPHGVRFRIQDMGQGFAWREFQETRPERMFDNHGRGILLARWEAFDRVEYLGNGNCVVAEITHSACA